MSVDATFSNSPLDDVSDEPLNRQNMKYVGIPKRLHKALERYAESRSDEFDRKSASWAARMAIASFLKEKGLWPPNESDEGEDSDEDS